ncbi:hypothetical protein [Microbacterium lacticum]
MTTVHPRTRSAYAIRLADLMERNELTPEIIAERRHAWYHLIWTQGKAEDMPEKHTGVCKSIVSETPGAVRARLRMSEAHYSKRASVAARRFDNLGLYEVLAAVAHGSASIEDVFPALRAEWERHEAQRLMRRHAAAVPTAIETCESIATLVWNHDGDVKTLDTLLFHALEGLDGFEIRKAFNRIAMELHNTFPDRPERAAAEVSA